MKLIVLLIIIFFLQLTGYGQMPSDDSSCIQNLSQAKKDYELGQHKFCINATWDLPFARMYNILDSLCKTKSLVFAPYPYIEHDVGFDPYTCYSNFMDSMLFKKHGSNFKSILIKEADSIFKARHINDTIPAYHCDKAPTYFKDTDTLTKDFFSNFHLPDTCDFIRNCSSCDFRVLFIVDLSGHPSHFEIYHSDSANFTCVDLVKENIIKSIKRIGKWIPGELGNRKVISYGDIMVNIFNKRIN